MLAYSFLFCGIFCLASTVCLEFAVGNDGERKILGLFQPRLNRYRCFCYITYSVVVSRSASLIKIIITRPVNAVVEDIAIGAVGLGFDSLIGQIGHSVVNGSPPQSTTFLRSGVAQTLSRGDGPYSLSSHASASCQGKIEDLIF